MRIISSVETTESAAIAALGQTNNKLNHNVTTTAGGIKIGEVSANNNNISRLNVDDVWIKSWPPAENVSYPRFQTAFHVDDYSSYLQEPDTSKKLIRQNQMLPIYCSIMGMIIISLLLYVVYKLWKQRESMANAKLSEVYSVNLNGSVKGSLGARGNSLMRSRNGPVTMATVGGVKGVTPESTTVNNSSCDGCPQWPKNMVEAEPLISRSLSSNIVAKDYADQPLNTVPLTILGLLCSELSQKGLTKLATTFSINLTDEYSPGIENLDLYQAALEAGSSVKSVDEKQIRDSVFLVERLLGRPGMTTGVMCSALRHADRADLIQLLIPSGVQNSLSSTTTDECRTDLSGMQSCRGSKNPRKPSGGDNQV